MPLEPMDDERHLETVVGPQIVARMHGLFRAVRTYALDNQTVRAQMTQLLRLLKKTMEEEHELALVAMGQCFYLNGARVRAEPSQITFFDSVSTHFEDRKLGGVRFLDGLTADELGAFFKIMLDHADPVRAARLGDALAGAGVAHVTPITLDELQAMQAELEAEHDPNDKSERGRAKETFWRAVRGARGAIMRTARTGRPAVRRIKRLVQPIVDSIMKNEYSIVGLTAIKNHDEYTYAHCVNVSILSIAMGQTLGLPRAALANLGVAALLHDIGKLTIPPGVLTKPDQLTASEWALMQRHPIEGVKIVSRMPGLSSLTLDALRVCMEHHMTYDGKSGYPQLAGHCTLGTLTRIVSAADCFDALTAHRTYRKRPFTGFEALSLLLGHDRERFDPAARWALVRTVGLYPAGTVMLTRSGYLVLSMSTNTDDLRRPHCTVLARPNGTMPTDEHSRTWDPMPADETVARVVPPDEFEASVDQLLAA